MATGRVGAAWAVVSGERAPLTQVVKTAIAVGLSWEVVEALLGHTKPIFAALAALLTVQVTVYQSVSRAAQRVVGVVAGVVVAFGIGRVAGLHAWTVGLVVLGALVVGWLLRLGPQGAVQVPISALLVMVIGASTPSYALDRVVDTAVGAVIGVAVSAVIVPPVDLESARTAVGKLLGSVAGLLADLGRADAGLASAELLGGARRLVGLVDEARGALAKARESIRWNPGGRARADEIERLERRLVLAERMAVQVRGVVRTLVDASSASSPEQLSGEGRRLLTVLLESAAAAVGAAVPGSPAAPVDEAARSGVVAATVEALRADARANPGSAWVVYGAVVTDVQRILDGARELASEATTRR